MEKKRSVGMLLFSIFFTFIALNEIFRFLAGIGVMLFKMPSNPAPFWTILLFIITQGSKVIFFILVVIGLLRFRKWCRLMLIWFYPLFLISGLIAPGWVFYWPFNLLHCVFYFGLLYYLTRSKVKEQFK